MNSIQPMQIKTMSFKAQETNPTLLSDIHQIDSLNALFDFKHYTDRVSIENFEQAMPENTNTTPFNAAANSIFDSYNKNYSLYSSSQQSNESVETLQIKHQLANINKQSIIQSMKPRSQDWRIPNMKPKAQDYHITKKSAKNSKKLIQNQQKVTQTNINTQFSNCDIKNQATFILLNDLITGDAFDA